MDDRIKQLILNDDLLRKINEAMWDKSVETILELLLTNEKVPENKPELEEIIDTVKHAFSKHEVLAVALTFVIKTENGKLAFSHHVGMKGDILTGLLNHAAYIISSRVRYSKELPKVVPLLKTAIALMATAVYLSLEEDVIGPEKNYINN